MPHVVQAAKAGARSRPPTREPFAAYMNDAGSDDEEGQLKGAAVLPGFVGIGEKKGRWRSKRGTRRPSAVQGPN